MIDVRFEDIHIFKMSRASGLFIGKRNVVNGFSHDSVQNEVVGSISGKENYIIANRWVKNKELWEEE